MNYAEAIQHAISKRWKTVPCSQGESCWCCAIVPEEPVTDDAGNEIIIAPEGTITKPTAEYIVKLHNERL